MVDIEMWAVCYQQRPIFYLDPHYGIENEDQAKRIACRILGLISTTTPGLSVSKVDIVDGPFDAEDLQPPA